MKLRKALEKARQQREAPAGHDTLPGPLTAETWKAPEYRESMEHRIDPGLVEKHRGVCIRPDAPEIEYYKILRTRIQQLSQQKKLNTVMITSPCGKEGKTVTCINLGLIFAREFHQTALLVDCDFKGQDIHRYFGIESSHSLIDYFLNGIALNRLIIWPGIEKLTLISGNKTVLDSSELLSSDMMRRLVREMGTRYDDRVVLFDAPPVLDRSEAITLAPMVDGILMVVEAGVTSKNDIEKAVRLLPEERFLGFVLNKKR